MVAGLEALDWVGIIKTLVYWTGIIILGVLMLMIVIAVWYYKSFPYKMIYWRIVGSGQGLTIDAAKTTRVKWGRGKTHWLTMHPWFNHKKIEPFPTQYVYPGGCIYAFKFGEEYIPADIGIDLEKHKFSIDPIPYSVRNWQIMELKQNEVEFTKKSWWDDNKSAVVAILTVALCCGLCVVTIYYTYSFGSTALANNAARIVELTQAVQNALTISSGG